MASNPTQLSDYLERLPGTTFKKLYHQPSTALAIFRRMVPKLAKTIVMALLYKPDPMSLDDLEAWVRPEFRREKDQALTTLKGLHMIQITSTLLPPAAAAAAAAATTTTTTTTSTAVGKKRENQYRQEIQLTTNFRRSFQQALEGTGSQGSFGVRSSMPTLAEVDATFLDAYARRKWDDILHYIVNSVGVRDASGSGPATSMTGPSPSFSSTTSSSSPGGVGNGGSGGGPKQSVKELLLAGKLVERREGSASSVLITRHGFTFLLQETNAQVWTLLLLWLEAADRSANPGFFTSVDMLQFLFMLSSMQPGTAYSTAALTEARRNMLPFLVDIGLVFISNQNPEQFYPTRFATTLTSTSGNIRSIHDGFSAMSISDAPGGGGGGGSTATGTSSASLDPDNNGIILETNFRIYAYTTNPLQIAVLALFCSLKARFANMVAGRLSRESIRRAIAFGITADQIIHYLGVHAHPQMRRTAMARDKPVLPPTVVDQIRLWQLENERMKTTVGFLFKDFEDREEFAATALHAQEVGVLVWRDDREQVFFASKMEQIRDFLKVRKRTS